jgi:hypothetical protein
MDLWTLYTSTGNGFEGSEKREEKRYYRKKRRGPPSVKTEIKSSTLTPVSMLILEPFEGIPRSNPLFHPHHQPSASSEYMVCRAFYLLLECISIESDPCPRHWRWCTLCFKTQSPSGHSWCILTVMLFTSMETAPRIPSSSHEATCFDFYLFLTDNTRAKGKKGMGGAGNSSSLDAPLQSDIKQWAK